MSSSNPYSATGSYDPLTENLNAPGDLPLASQTQRFLTSIIDNILLYFINTGVGVGVGLMAAIVGGGQLSPQGLSIAQIIATLIGLLVALAYYCILEMTTGMTLGKLIMGTKVVTETGGVPSFGQCLGRSACRFIPFEAFSFFGNKGFPIGWHDSIPKTRVIKTR
jgi:uncharacterized RDD family membrane protein YckC